MPYKDPKKDKERRQKYYLNHKEELSKKARERYLRDPQKIKDRVKKRYDKNRESILLHNKERYLKNKDRVLEQTKLWHSKNREKVKKIKATYRERHRAELRQKGREYAREHIAQHRANKRAWRKSNPDKTKNEKLKLRFNISINEYNDLLAKQNSQCGICKSNLIFSQNNPKSPCVDHCHTTQKIRGILCRMCNSGLGGLKDSPELLRNAVLWITGNKKPSSLEPAPIPTIHNRKKYVLKKEYGLTLKQYLDLLNAQGNRCGICDRALNEFKTNNVDHDHNTDKVRGILCPPCNRSIGLFSDNPEIISKAIEWVKEN